ncbi:MAG TPA: heat-inducible transcriptional repressor HrcA, partial [Vicinamibacteria bacterium]|nr:heat-inducible transcriptional repressor HrcA [Vicinamibacteria bacterium]
RNIMAELEKNGYLSHPHTSAGRMPTDEGYRVYVDSLMGPAALGPREAAAIESELRPRDASPREVAEHASQLLSRLSRSVGFVMTPDLARTTFRHIDLVRLPHPRVLVVMVSRTGLVTHKLIEVDEQLAQEELQACANYLNVHFAGMTLDAIRGRLLQMMTEDKTVYDTLLKKVVSVGRPAFAAEASGDASSVYVDGASNILDQPEFEDVSRMRALFKTFEEKTRLVKIVNACLDGFGVRVIIGREIPDPALQGVSLVTTGFPVGAEGWALGVMGPTRMEYPHVMSVVDHVARVVSSALQELGR